MELEVVGLAKRVLTTTWKFILFVLRFSSYSFGNPCNMIISGDNFHFVLVAIGCNFEICIVLVRVIKIIYSHILPVSNCSSGEGFALVIQGAELK